VTQEIVGTITNSTQSIIHLIEDLVESVGGVLQNVSTVGAFLGQI
jgi:hypothetical protein